MKVLKYFKAFFIHVLQLCTYYYSLNYYQLKYSYMKNLFRTFVILFWQSYPLLAVMIMMILDLTLNH